MISNAEKDQWESNPEQEQEYTVEEYEQFRCGDRRKAKKLSAHIRHKMLVERGVTLSQIAKAAKEVRQIKEECKPIQQPDKIEVPKVKNRLVQKFLNIM